MVNQDYGNQKGLLLEGQLSKFRFGTVNNHQYSNELDQRVRNSKALNPDTPERRAEIAKFQQQQAKKKETADKIQALNNIGNNTPIVNNSTNTDAISTPSLLKTPIPEQHIPDANFFIGAGATIGEELMFSENFGTWMGRDFKIRSQSWGGNGFTGGKFSYARAGSKLFKFAGAVSTVYGAYDIEEQHQSGQISNGERISEHVYNGLGAIPFWGWAITIGHESANIVFD